MTDPAQDPSIEATPAKHRIEAHVGHIVVRATTIQGATISPGSFARVVSAGPGTQLLGGEIVAISGEAMYASVVLIDGETFLMLSERFVGAVIDRSDTQQSRMAALGAAAGLADAVETASS